MASTPRIDRHCDPRTEARVSAQLVGPPGGPGLARHNAAKGGTRHRGRHPGPPGRRTGGGPHDLSRAGLHEAELVDQRLGTGMSGWTASSALVYDDVAVRDELSAPDTPGFVLL